MPRGQETKKGTKGIVANYITRTKAVKKLQISLKDFRRLCILKGIYPRDPKKKKDGKDKTYYHIKDIAFLMHEPLLVKFRELKTFLQKFKRAQVKGDKTKAKALQKSKPVFTLDHLVKERYPTFVDALRDLDDPLSMIAIFANLPSHILNLKSTSPELDYQRSQLCLTALREFQNYVFRSRALTKVFVSIKGIYYEANINGNSIIWLVPFKFSQTLPMDVDYRIMLTFLQFYLSMLKFVNFKLYHDQGLHYPPKTDFLLEASGAHLAALQVSTLESARAHSLNESAKKQIAGGKAVDLTDVLSNLKKNKKETKAEKTKAAAMVEEDEDQVAGFEQEGAEEGEGKDQFEDESSKIGRLFKGLVFLLSREVPQDSLEFVILSAGGKVVRQEDITELQVQHDSITHHIMDRPTLQHNLLNRVYVQPQWLYDCFNVRALLPHDPYAPGAVCPPHLSPFVDNAKVGYTPEQAHVLQAWAEGKPYTGPAQEAEGFNGEQANEEEEEEEEDDDDEDEDEEDEEDEEDGDDGEEEVEGEGNAYDEVESGGEDGKFEGEDEEEEEAKKQKLSKKGKMGANKRKLAEEAEDEELGLAKIMMSKKNARLYSRIKYGENVKAEENDELLQKRQKIERAKKAGKK